MRCAGWLVILWLGVVAIPCAHGQEAITDVITEVIITGRVTGPDGRPIAGASVRVAPLPTGADRVVTTDGDGAYWASEPANVERVALDVRAMGYAPAHVEAERAPGVRRMSVAIELGLARHVLERVVTQRSQDEAPARPGESARSYSGDKLHRLPVGVGDSVATIGMMVPGGLAPNGQQTGSAAFTYDGTAAGLRALPPEAIGGVTVTPNAFDVGTARSAGTQVAVTTQSGQDAPHGALAYTLNDRALQLGAPSSTVNGFQSTSTIDAAYGGPLIHHRLLAFGALRASRTTAAATSLLSANATALRALGVSPDSVARLTRILATLGAPVSPTGVPRSVITDGANVFGRLDATPTTSETITLTAHAQGRSQDGETVAATALPSTGVQSSYWGGAVHAMLSSRLGSALQNDVGAAVFEQQQSVTPTSRLPNGTVTVGSSDAVSSLTFGGSGSSAQRQRTDGYEFDEHLVWTPGAHRVVVGGRVGGNRSVFTSGPNAYGSFAYTSLADLAAGVPASFTRTPVPLSTEGATLTGSMFLADNWTVSSALAVSFGLRAEETEATALPPYNGAIDSTFHIRTDRLPAPLALDPGIGFRWTPGGRDTLVIVSGGVSVASASSPGAYVGSVGQPTVQLVCTGAATPTPNWAGYSADAGAIPTACVGGPSMNAGARPVVSVFDPRQPTPRATSAALSVAKPLGSHVSLSMYASGVTGRGVAGASDLNLSPVPQFTLPEEGNRPVYVTAGSIDPGTGAVSVLGSRVHTDFGQVLALTSRLRQLGGSIAAGLTITGAEDGQFAQISYSITGSRQQAYYPTPLTALWAPGPTDGQQQLLVVASQPIGRDVDVGLIGSLTSGSRFTPQVSQDVTGTGAQVPGAFVFDPASTRDTAVASAMRSLLAHAPGSVRDCLRSQLGSVAGLNSCTGPWQPVLNLQANFHPAWFGLNRRFTLSLIVSNVLTGLDAIVHGPNHLAGWGDPGQPDPVLLYVEGFDPAARAFRYSVNSRFGSGLASRTAYGVPSQLTVRGRVAFGH